MMQRSGSSDQYSILKDLQREVLAISPSDEVLYNRVSDSWLDQFDKIFIHGLFHAGLVYLLLNKVSEETFQKIYYISYDSEIQLAARCFSLGNVDAPNVLVLQRFIHWLVPPHYREVRKDFFDRCRTEHFNFMDNLHPIVPQPLQPADMERAELLIREKLSANQKDVLNVMVGHSCARNDNHHDVLKMISSLVFCNVRVVLPMSYHVDISYRESVRNLGVRIFGEKLQVWEKYEDPYVYQSKLALIDVAIFDQAELSGFGVITYLLLSGCKVFISSVHMKSSDIATLVRMGVKVYDASLLINDPLQALEPLSLCEAMHNFKVLSETYYDREKIIGNWEALASVGM